MLLDKAVLYHHCIPSNPYVVFSSSVSCKVPFLALFADDDTRVVLDGDDGEDYINASYVEVIFILLLSPGTAFILHDELFNFSG